jgi:hypothetical protein
VERLSEAREELTKLLTLRELATIPFVVLGKKIDIDGALSENEFRQAMNLWQTTGKGNVFIRERIRPIEVFMWYVPCLMSANLQLDCNETRIQRGFHVVGSVCLRAFPRDLRIHINAAFLNPEANE